MRLKDCTKEELLFIIEHLQLCALSSGACHVDIALIEVETRRRERKCAEAKRLTDHAFQKRQEYIDLLAPYEGKSFLDVPDSVLNRAAQALREAEAADRKWRKLMGIGARPNRKGEDV